MPLKTYELNTIFTVRNLSQKLMPAITFLILERKGKIFAGRLQPPLGAWTRKISPSRSLILSDIIKTYMLGEKTMLKTRSPKLLSMVFSLFK